MSTIQPASAVVRPRVTDPSGGGSRPLGEVIYEIAEEHSTGIIWLVGGIGSGKTMAIEHLSRLFAGDARFVFLDDATQREADISAEDRLVAATVFSPINRRGQFLHLQPWGIDELAEYLLASHPSSCQSVLERLGSAARQSWAPQVARIVLDRFAADPALADPVDALLLEVLKLLPDDAELEVAAEFCLALMLRGEKRIDTVFKSLSKSGIPHKLCMLLRHPEVQLPLAAAWIVAVLKSRRSCRDLARFLPVDLVDLVGKQCCESPTAKKRLERILSSRRAHPFHPMAASIMVRARPDWRPDRQRKGKWRLEGGYFSGVNWAEIDLTGAVITNCDFTDANLETAVLDCAMATGAQFPGADLQDAYLTRIAAMRASFAGANLQRATMVLADLKQVEFSGADLSDAALMNSDLTGASLDSARLCRADLTQACLIGAQLEEVDFSDAILRNAYLSHTDLRTTNLDGACFEHARLMHAQLEDVHVRDAKLRGAIMECAHLTGSMLPDADLRDANLSGAHLAEINWERADLRGADLRSASFHMGSSRSGLVGSPIALEGSMTGFYTDDREEIYFKRPEEIRKANLRGADLRGANVEGVDFYLVDLREARLDPQQLKQAQRTGAILDDMVA